MYWRVARAKAQRLHQLGPLGGGGPQPLWEGAAVDDEEKQQHQDEAKVRDDPGDPDQHLLQDPGQAVEVEPADRGVELLLGDAELAEPAGGLVDQAGELGLVTGEQRGQPRHRQHQRGGHRQQGSVGDQHGQRHRQPARDAAPLQPGQQGMDRDRDRQGQEGRPDDAGGAAQPAATTTAPAPPSRTNTARGSDHSPSAASDRDAPAGASAAGTGRSEVGDGDNPGLAGASPVRLVGSWPAAGMVRRPV